MNTTKMKKLTADTRYVKLKDTAPNTVILTKAVMTEVRPGKFGDTLIFSEENTGEEIGIGAGGQLKSLYSRGKLHIGGIYNIVYKGKKTLKDGRAAHDFDISEFEVESEMSEEAEEFLNG